MTVQFAAKRFTFPSLTQAEPELVFQFLGGKDALEALDFQTLGFQTLDF